MKGKILHSLLPIGLAASLISSLAVAGGSEQYEVTITNLTRGQSFTPILVASHRRGVELFKLGEPASEALSKLAEGGDTMPLTTMLESNPRVVDVQNSGGLLAPGESVTVKVAAHHGARRISLTSMMIPTNDAIIALNSVKAPKDHRMATYRSIAYDAGSEPNDELCANIPGPVCGGTGISPDDSAEGYVHTHAGIHGIGDLAADMYDWRNPVAEIKIRRTKNYPHRD